MKLWMVFLPAALLLTACSNDAKEDVTAWMSEQDQHLNGHLEPLPTVNIYQPFSYQAADLVDPFSRKKMDLAFNGTDALAPDLSRNRERLENYDLEELSLVGMISQGPLLQALIQTPDGKVYQVQVGHHMGKNFGMVTAIHATEVLLKEIVEDSTDGGWAERMTTLSLSNVEQTKK